MEAVRRLYGGELERIMVCRETGVPTDLSELFFRRLQAISDQLSPSTLSYIRDKIVGVKSSYLGEQGIDCGFHIQESALPPSESLSDLANRAVLDLGGILEAGESSGIGCLNSSAHPFGVADLTTYCRLVVPRSIYSYLWYRGWDHTAGFNGSVQTSPSTSVSISEAARAVSTIIGAGAAFIALSANSPYLEGRRCGLKEGRLKIWERMFRSSRYRGDLFLSRFPPRPFLDLKYYFSWMFGEGTNMHVVSHSTGDSYKTKGERWLIEGPPSLLDYFKSNSWVAVDFDSLQTLDLRSRRITPELRHLEEHQWAQFAGARVRFTLREHYTVAGPEVAEAFTSSRSDAVEELLSKVVNSMWIEGRDPGANSPDRTLLDAGIDSTMIIAPMAMQAGLLNNLEKAWSYIQSVGWRSVGELREAAIKDGLDGEFHGITVKSFTRKLLELSSEGLCSDELKYLAYYDYVSRTGMNGADRAIRYVGSSKRSEGDALRELVGDRLVFGDWRP